MKGGLRMAFAIKNDVIYITRGDDAEINVTIRGDDGSVYNMQSGDQLILTVRALPTHDSDVLLSVAANTNVLSLSHEATEALDAGKYSADVQLTTSVGKRRTIWPSVTDNMMRVVGVKNFCNFVILPEVTINE